MPVQENNRIKFEIKPDSITLRCKSAELKDAGKYALTLTNEKGSDSIAMNVIVVGKRECHTNCSVLHVLYKIPHQVISCAYFFVPEMSQIVEEFYMIQYLSYRK